MEAAVLLRMIVIRHMRVKPNPIMKVPSVIRGCRCT